MFKELKLEELKRKRRNYQAQLEQVNQEIAKLEDDRLQYKKYIKENVALCVPTVFPNMISRYQMA